MGTMAYNGSDPYAFISYSHADKAKVELLLRILYRHEKRFWYDDGIEFSEDWQIVINKRLEQSSIFILFLTNGVEQRSEVIREIRMAIKKRNETNKKYRVFVILLERVPIRHLFKKYADIMQLLDTVQFISAANFGGITISFQEKLLSSEIWKHCATDQEREQLDLYSPEMQLSSILCEHNKKTSK